MAGSELFLTFESSLGLFELVVGCFCALLEDPLRNRLNVRNILDPDLVPPPPPLFVLPFGDGDGGETMGEEGEATLVAMDDERAGRG